MKKKIKELLELRALFARYGQVGNLQAVNYELARIARRLKINYYTL